MPGVRITFDLPYALYLSPGRVFEFDLDNRRVKVQIQDKRFTEMTRFGKSATWEIRNDRAGTFRYSKVFIEFRVDHDITQEETISFGHKVANRLIEVYRHVSMRSYIEPLRSYQVISPGILTEGKDGQWNGTINMGFPRGIGLALPNDPIHLQDTVANWLETGREITVHEILLINAKDSLEKEEYRAALMDGVSAVEVFVEQFLRNAYGTWGWTEMQVGRHLVAGRNWQISERLKKLVREVTGRNVSWNAEVWNPWQAGKKMRDRVVHGGLLFSRRDHAGVEAAINACEGLVAHVKGLPVLPKPSQVAN